MNEEECSLSSNTYYYYKNKLHIDRDTIQTAEARGIEQGMEQKKVKIAISMLKKTWIYSLYSNLPAYQSKK